MALKIGAIEWNVAIEYAERFFGDRGVAEIMAEGIEALLHCTRGIASDWHRDLAKGPLKASGLFYEKAARNAFRETCGGDSEQRLAR
jgi:hypothetical protein